MLRFDFVACFRKYTGRKKQADPLVERMRQEILIQEPRLEPIPARIPLRITVYSTTKTKDQEVLFDVERNIFSVVYVLRKALLGLCYETELQIAVLTITQDCGTESRLTVYVEELKARK